MYISYFDETGDDGYPRYSSPLFLLTSIYMHHQDWKANYNAIISFRKYLKETYKLPIKTEYHTKYLLLLKKVYRQYGWSKKVRLNMLMDTADHISCLKMRSINVCIDKKKITKLNEKLYSNILNAALNFNIQRIANDIGKKDAKSKFIIISDEGRIAPMTKTTRKMQKINYIPSHYTASSYRKEIGSLIEDPLPKNSNNSYFIQIADFISFLVYLYYIPHESWHGRLRWLTKKDVELVLNRIKPILNIEASRANPYGFVCYPK